MKLPSEEEKVKDAVRSMDAGTSRTILFNREGQVIHANEKARALFNRPILTRDNLPQELTAGVDDALAKGHRSVFCFQVTGGPLLRSRLCPEHFYFCQPPKNPKCALLVMEEETVGCFPGSIAMLLANYLGNACVPIATLDAEWNYPSRDVSAPDFQDFSKIAVAGAYRAARRVSDILASLGGSYSCGAREAVTLASIIAEAYQKLKFYRSLPKEIVPLQLVCKGPDALGFSTGNLNTLRTLFTEILLAAQHPSNSVTIQWAENDKRLGVPSAKVEIATENVHTGDFGLFVAEEITLDMHGCMETTPGNPGTVSLWLPLTLPEGF